MGFCIPFDRRSCQRHEQKRPKIDSSRWCLANKQLSSGIGSINAGTEPRERTARPQPGERATGWSVLRSFISGSVKEPHEILVRIAAQAGERGGRKPAAPQTGRSLSHHPGINILILSLSLETCSLPAPPPAQIQHILQKRNLLRKK